MLKLRALSHAALWVGLLTGCTTQAEVGKWEGPEAVAVAETKDWTFAEEKARILQSKHYRIHTTIQDEAVLALLPQVMEGAHSVYRQIVPGLPVSERPLDCYIFRARSEWDSYTQRHGGKDAQVYLQIRSGGYTVYDRYVAYFIGGPSTYAVAAHEGWHQFAGRYFKGRLPPFFEEGLSCMFETITWKDQLPRWNLSQNTPRASALRRALQNKELWSLERLCAMHAGDVVGESNDRIDAFYAQSWAFARFMWEAEGAKHRPAMQKWLTETANGTVYDPTRTHARAMAPWSRRAVKPMIEHYLGMGMPEIEEAYLAYVKKIAAEEVTFTQAE